ncbi:MAG: flagellar protein FlgN [Ruminococcus sp.]|jgi:hypothetical protein|nr:flagellar protein FlgN [Ruminococcus sp.]
MENYNRFYEFMLSYTEFFENVSTLEEEKFKALYSREPERIDAALKEQITTERRTFDFEEQRVKLLADMGLEGKKFSEIIEDFGQESGTDTSEYKNLRNVLQRLRIAVDKTKLFNGKSLEFAQMNLNIINEISGAENIDTTTYSSKGEQKDSSRPSFFNKSV